MEQHKIYIATRYGDMFMNYYIAGIYQIWNALYIVFILRYPSNSSIGYSYQTTFHTNHYPDYSNATGVRQADASEIAANATA